MKTFPRALIICLFPVAISAQQPEFTQHVVTSTFTKGADVIAVDIDQDGDMDIISVNTHTSAEVAWWKNNGYNEFTEITIMDNLNKVRSVRAEDINDDQHICVTQNLLHNPESVVYTDFGERNFLRI